MQNAKLQFKIKNFKNLKKELPGIQRNVILAKYTTFKIGGPAKYFFEARKKEDLIKAIKTAREFKIPFFILGGGSNLLVSDKGYEGIVIKNQISNIKYQKNGNIYVETGIKLVKLVELSLKKSLSGLEWAAGIPGTVGGAIYGNAGAFGFCIADVIKDIETLDFKNFKIKTFSFKNYKPKYKDTIFKRKKNLIILSAIICLKKGNKKEIQKKIKYNLDYRKENHPLNFPSAGSVFKNFIPAKKEFFPTELKLFEELEKFKKMGMVPAGFLIDKCGLKGKKIGDVKISEKHANFIVNLGKGKEKDILKLINLIKKKVKNKFGIKLEEEIIVHT